MGLNGLLGGGNHPIIIVIVFIYKTGNFIREKTYFPDNHAAIIPIPNLLSNDL